MSESREAFDLFHPACRANLRHRWRWEMRHRPVAFLLLVARDTWHRVCSSATKAELQQALHDARMELGKESTRLLRLLNTAKGERDEARAELTERREQVEALQQMADEACIAAGPFVMPGKGLVAAITMLKSDLAQRTAEVAQLTASHATTTEERDEWARKAMDRKAEVAALREAISLQVGFPQCAQLHHATRDRHAHDEPCPVEARIHAALAATAPTQREKEQ